MVRGGLKVKGKWQASKLPLWGKILMWVLLAVLVIAIVYSKLIANVSLGKIIRIGNPFDRSMKEIVFQSCGIRLPNYKYSIKFPANWTVVRRSYDEISTYFDATSPDKIFTVSCTNQGVGGDVCDDKYRIKLDIPGINDQPCFGLVDGKWSMGVLNLPTDTKTNATVSFWAKGLEKASIQDILNSYKLIGNQ